MITTLLIDLDNTLLGNDMEDFLPPYLQRLSAYMADVLPPDRFVPELLAGTQKMMENLDPTITLEKIFADYFYPALGVAESDVRHQFENFYANVFPSLQEVTSPRSEATPFMRTAAQAGYELVIATSPVFPRTAIDQRLAWAGVPVDKFDYSLVTSFENFHFTKPHLEYYAEILGRIGRASQETAMIGNDPTNDLIPANEMGIAVYHVSDSPEEPFAGGSLNEVLPWVAEVSSQDPPPIPNLPKALLACQRGHLATLISLTHHLDHDQWGTSAIDGEWTPVEIVAHLRDVEREVNLPRIEAILSENNPYLSSFDTDRWAEERKYIDQSGSHALADLITARKESITRLENISLQEWSRPARHALLGPTILEEVVRIVVDHDLLHLKQIRSVLNQNGSR